MLRTLPTLLLLGAPLHATQTAAAQAGSPAAEAPQTAPAPADAGTQDEDAEGRARVIELVRAGDYAAAAALLDALLVAERTRAAEASLAAGAPLDAVSAVDEALAIDGLGRADRARLLMLRGKATFAAAESGAVDPAMYGEAQENFEEAASLGAGVSAAFRASRAARMLGVTQGALDLARSGARWIDGGEGRAAGLDLDQHYARTWAEAAFSRFVEVAGSGATDEATLALRTELASEVQDALARVVGDAPTDPWAYGQLGNLALWQGDQDGAVAAAEAGLFAAPDSQEMHSAVVAALGNRAEAAARAEGLGDAEVQDARFRAVVGRYGELLQTYPEKALFYWYPAFQTFFKASGDVRNGQDVRELFVEAEALFQSCAERDANYADVCTDYVILSRDGQAFSMINGDEADAAVELLFGVEALRPIGDPAVTERGLTPALELAYLPYMPSALALQSSVVQGLLRNPTDIDAMTKAAAIADRQLALRPDDANIANNAGFLNRDVGVLVMSAAQRILAGAGDDETRAEGMALRDRAQEYAERSYAAYQVAAALAPDDVRVVNDTGLMMAYYLRTDRDAAVRYFEDSIADGTVQVAAAREMAPDALADAGIDLPALVEAWGDAHENMGVVAWTFDEDPAKAIEWYERSLEIGPPSRNWMKRQLLPLLAEWVETGERPKGLDRLEARTVWTHNDAR